AASSALLSALAIAVAMSSANFSRRASASSGSSSSDEKMLIAPQRRPSTMIGLATVEKTPRRRAASATGPVIDDQSIASTRAERLVRYTSAVAMPSWNSQRVP